MGFCYLLWPTLLSIICDLLSVRIPKPFWISTWRNICRKKVTHNHALVSTFPEIKHSEAVFLELWCLLRRKYPVWSLFQGVILSMPSGELNLMNSWDKSSLCYFYYRYAKHLTSSFRCWNSRIWIGFEEFIHDVDQSTLNYPSYNKFAFPRDAVIRGCYFSWSFYESWYVKDFLLSLVYDKVCCG